ncbi:MAG: SCP2 sterol-binding domain-containing protein [Nitrospirota bacterium]
MNRIAFFLVFFVLLSVTTLYSADKAVFMSSAWAKAAVDTWNSDPTLTVKLFESGWVTNTKKGREFKTIEVYREDCPASSHVQLKLVARDNKAVAVYGGEAIDKEPDYIMWAETGRWIEMGKGQYGPMKAMSLRRLKFKGPMWEAMKNMGPFSAFLLLTGKIDADYNTCSQ